MGLKADGTVVACGDNANGQCDVGDYSDIVEIDAGYYHGVGIKSDGTVMTNGANWQGQCDIGGYVLK